MALQPTDIWPASVPDYKVGPEAAPNKDEAGDGEAAAAPTAKEILCPGSSSGHGQSDETLNLQLQFMQKHPHTTPPTEMMRENDAHLPHGFPGDADDDDAGTVFFEGMSANEFFSNMENMFERMSDEITSKVVSQVNQRRDGSPAVNRPGRRNPYFGMPSVPKVVREMEGDKWLFVKTMMRQQMPFHTFSEIQDVMLGDPLYVGLASFSAFEATLVEVVEYLKSHGQTASRSGVLRIAAKNFFDGHVMNLHSRFQCVFKTSTPQSNGDVFKGCDKWKRVLPEAISEEWLHSWLEWLNDLVIPHLPKPRKRLGAAKEVTRTPFTRQEFVTKAHSYFCRVFSEVTKVMVGITRNDIEAVAEAFEEILEDSRASNGLKRGTLLARVNLKDRVQKSVDQMAARGHKFKSSGVRAVSGQSNAEAWKLSSTPKWQPKSRMEALKLVVSTHLLVEGKVPKYPLSCAAGIDYSRLHETLRGKPRRHLMQKGAFPFHFVCADAVRRPVDDGGAAVDYLKRSAHSRIAAEKSNELDGGPPMEDVLEDNALFSVGDIGEGPFPHSDDDGLHDKKRLSGKNLKVTKPTTDTSGDEAADEEDLLKVIAQGKTLPLKTNLAVAKGSSWVENDFGKLTSGQLLNGSKRRPGLKWPSQPLPKLAMPKAKAKKSMLMASREEFTPDWKHKKPSKPGKSAATETIRTIDLDMTVTDDGTQSLLMASSRKDFFQKKIHLRTDENSNPNGNLPSRKYWGIP